MRARFFGVSVLSALLASAPAFAQQADGKPPEPDATAQARATFVEGVEAVKRAEWSAARTAFERSAALRPHATTTFNIGACERATGDYTLARATFRRALSEDSARPGELDPTLHEQAVGFVAEIDRLLSRAVLTLAPADATIAVDGRPLSFETTTGTETRFVAGIAPPGPGSTVTTDHFVVLLNPGVHVFVLSRKGFTDAVVNETLAPGSETRLDLRLDLLPATLSVSANVAGAIVNVDDKDFGPVPVEIRRPAGVHRVKVEKPGFDPYESHLAVNAGEWSTLNAVLTPERTPVTKTWWFWTSAAAVVAGGVVATYFLTRPDPQPPPYQGGSTGWVVYPTPSGVR